MNATTGNPAATTARAIGALLALACALVAVALLASCARPSATGADDARMSDAAVRDRAASAGADEDVDAAVERLLASMPLEQKVAQLFIVSSDTLPALPGAGGNPFDPHAVGGILFTAHALESPDQVRAMLDEARRQSNAAVGVPAFLCVDEEGGTVARVANSPAFGVDNVGSARAVGPAAAGEAADAIGGYLADLGFNVDFAPVCDLAADEDDVMFDRSFGSDPDQVAAAVSAQVQALSAHGMLCSLKHFPGIGGADGDSHDGLIASTATLDAFRASALVPFAAGIRAGAPFVMAGHIATPDATGDGLPASLSRRWLSDVLRGELGFEGVIVTDALEMGAVGDIAQRDLGVAALDAGADMLLCPSDFDAMYAGVLEAVADGRLSEERIDESLQRVLRVKLRMLQ